MFALVVMALGIGANTAVFNVVNAGVADTAGLVRIGSTICRVNKHHGTERGVFCRGAGNFRSTRNSAQARAEFQ